MTTENSTPETVSRRFNRNSTDNARLEAEIAEYDRVTTQSTETSEDPPATLNAEEETFKKRYSDLRTYMNKKDQEHKAAVANLQRQLNEVLNKQVRLPRSEEEIEQFAKEFPDSHAIIETIAERKARKLAQEVEERFAKIEEQETALAMSKAEMELARLQPHFEEIKADPEFHAWAETQSKWVQEALYDNALDAQAASDAIDLFKAKTNWRPAKERKSEKKPREQSRDASLHVKGNVPDEPRQKSDTLYESEVRGWSLKEFERREAEVDAAMASGKFVYDVTGGAR